MKLNSTLVRFKFTGDNKKNSNNANLKLQTTDLVNKPFTYYVRAGDKLIVIADQYNVSVDDIVTLNNIKDASVIKVGQKLLVPRNSHNINSHENRILVISGYGSGHGVGMSQWGARYIANQGDDAEEILKHFYRGVEIKPFKKYFL